MNTPKVVYQVGRSRPRCVPRLITLSWLYNQRPPNRGR